MTRPRRHGALALMGAALLSGALLAGCAQTKPAQAPTAEPPQHHAEGYHHHGSAHHSFADAERWAARFEDPSRDAWQRPDALIALLDVQRDALIADIGSATGYLTVRLARAAPLGVVYGVDIEPEMVRYLGERAEREGLENLHSLLGAPDDPKLPGPVDLVVIVNTYHHIEDRVAYMRRLLASLTPAGRVAIIDFKPGPLPVGPGPSVKLPPSQVEDELRAAGYHLSQSDDTLLPYQFIQVFVRAP